ncbi:hypothetical protein M5C72_01665 [Companilactobacillus allii]|uniref:Uncharacterized protein n=1 Tax=Companilactobacillus allii TaxID=1847728 RepID=A0A1P8Q1Z3_9LACO|nr:hypothetical protein [Companilactobacillus allii]APX71878.1 hypothetical protein BTM29_04585 [Companilactobacillus allii]USQ68969.1 hypothetical protein M5C72_01665 [Companilactobacillus allii]
MKVKVLLINFINLILRNFLYPTLLMIFLSFELAINSLLELNMNQKFGLLVIGVFFVSLLTSMNFLKNDAAVNRYLFQKINNYWLYFLMQVLTLTIVAIFSAIVMSIFSFTFSINSIVAILPLATTGLVGVGIAFICKPQWNNHPYIAQIGIVVFVYIALAGTGDNILNYIQWFIPPVSKVITIFQEQSSIRALIPVSIQQLVYSCVLIILSGTFYEKKMSN